MRLAAKRAGVVTQMGNQIQSHAAYRTAVKLVHDGADRQSAGGPLLAERSDALAARGRSAGRCRSRFPPTLAIGTTGWASLPSVPTKPRSIIRSIGAAWQDFSNGQFGDFGCHILDPVFMALELTAPTSIRAEAPPINREVWTKSATVHYEFPGTPRTAGETLRLTWHDGEGPFPAPRSAGLAAAISSCRAPARCSRGRRARC